MIPPGLRQRTGVEGWQGVVRGLWFVLFGGRERSGQGVREQSGGLFWKRTRSDSYSDGDYRYRGLVAVVSAAEVGGCG